MSGIHSIFSLFLTFFYSPIKVEDKPEFAERQAEILMDRSLVKERWGTIKKGKYGRSQSGHEKIYTGWFIDNDDHLFSICFNDIWINGQKAPYLYGKNGQNYAET